jgi:MFS family permease
MTVVGSSLGGVVYPLIFTSLTKKVGFPWTARVMGFISLATCSVAVALMRTRVRPRRVRSLVDPTSFRETPYLFFCAAMFCSNFGFFVPIFYLQTYALKNGMADARELALNLISILNGASILGRLLPSLVVPWIGPANTMICVAGMAGAVVFGWIGATNVAGNVTIAALYGLFSGGIVSLPAVVLASITEDLSFLGARFGTVNFFSAIGSLCGPPIAGAILRANGGDYLGLQLFAGIAISGTSLCLWGARVARAGPSLAVKV